MSSPRKRNNTVQFEDYPLDSANQDSAAFGEVFELQQIVGAGETEDQLNSSSSIEAIRQGRMIDGRERSHSAIPASLVTGRRRVLKPQQQAAPVAAGDASTVQDADVSSLPHATDAEDAGDSVDDNKTKHQDDLIQKAAKIKGMRLRYLFIVLCVFSMGALMLFINLLEMQLRDTLLKNGKLTIDLMSEAVSERAVDFMYQAANAGQSINVVRDALAVQANQTGLSYSRESEVLDRLALCGERSSLGLMFFNQYDPVTGEIVKNVSCQLHHSPSLNTMAKKVPPVTNTTMIEIDQSYSYVYSYVPEHLDDLEGDKNGENDTVVMVQGSQWNKELFGRHFFSEATAGEFKNKHIATSVMMRNLTSYTNGGSQDQYQVLVHSLTDSFPQYAQEQPTSQGLLALDRFQTRCNFGTAHTWYVRVNQSEARNGGIPSTVRSAYPEPYIETGFRWNFPNSGVMCVVVCATNGDDSQNDFCDVHNPAQAAFFIVIESRWGYISEFTVDMIYILSVSCSIMIVIICTILHVAIAIPAQFLHKKIAATVTMTPWKKSRWEKIKYGSTKCLWVGDMKSLIKTFNMLAALYYMNRKYVPEHVLNRQAAELMEHDVSIDEPTDIAGATLTNDTASVGAPYENLDDEEVIESMMQSQLHSMSNVQENTTIVEVEIPVSLNRRESRRMMSPSEQTPFAAAATLANSTRGPPADLDNTPRPSVNRRQTTRHSIMQPTRHYDAMSSIDDATILCVHIDMVEEAYGLNFGGAEVQHRHIYASVNSVIRKWKGETFLRTGCRFAVAWNAFESRPDHTMRGVNCALELAAEFDSLRQSGLMMGIAVHRGPIVCGVLTDQSTTANVVLGSTVEVGICVAELGSKLPYFSVMLSEPVKQTISIFYECIIIDVIRLTEDASPMTLFEVRGPNRAHATPLARPRENSFLRRLDDSNTSTALDMSATVDDRHEYCVLYNKAFARFRSHQFADATAALRSMEKRYGLDTIIERLLKLCVHYSNNTGLPKPYHRELPRWMLYEASAFYAKIDQALSGPQCTVVVSGPGNQPPGPHTGPLRVRPSHKRTNSGGGCAVNTPFLGPTAHPDGPVTDLKADLRNAAKQQRSPRSTTTASRSNGSLTTPAYGQSSSIQPLSAFEAVNPQNSSVNSGFQEDSFSSPEFVQVRKNSSLAGEMVLELPPAAIHTDPASPNMERPATAPGVSPSEKAVGEESAMKDSDSNGASEEGAADRQISTQSSGAEEQLGDGGLARPVCTSTTASATSASPAATTPAGNMESLFDTGVIKSDSFHSIANSITGTLNASLAFNPSQFESKQLPVEFTSTRGVNYQRSDKILGRGSYGCVYLGMEQHTGRLVAIKFLPLPDKEDELEKISNEVEIMDSIHDTNLVDFYGYALFNGKIALMQECMVAGSLDMMMSSFSQLATETTRNFMQDVLKGLRKLHAKGIIHRDVKPQNVLLSTSGHAKISDFGASASISMIARQMVDGVVLGTPMYLAPEAARAQPCEKSDIWSVGVMFLQLVTGSLPFKIDASLKANPALFVFRIGIGQLKPTIPDLPEVSMEFVNACLADKVDDRMTADELLELPFFSV